MKKEEAAKLQKKLIYLDKRLHFFDNFESLSDKDKLSYSLPAISNDFLLALERNEIRSKLRND